MENNDIRIYGTCCLRQKENWTRMSWPRRARSVTQTTSSNAALCHSKFKSGQNHGVVLLALRDMEKGNRVCSPSIRGYNRPLWFDTVGAPDVIWKRPSFWAIVEQFFEASKQEMIQLFVILQIRDICRVRMGRWIAISNSFYIFSRCYGFHFNQMWDIRGNFTAIISIELSWMDSFPVIAT